MGVVRKPQRPQHSGGADRSSRSSATLSQGDKDGRCTGRWWYRPLIPALRRQRPVDLCEFKANLVYTVSSRTAKTVTQRNPVSKNTKSRVSYLPETK